MDKDRNLMQETKEVWNENKGKVKVGVICLLIGVICGLLKGIDTQSNLTKDSIIALVDKLPKIPDISYEDALASIPKEDFLRCINQLDQ